jgi:phosphoglycerate dehydrogenase-like enzyme
VLILKAGLRFIRVRVLHLRLNDIGPPGYRPPTGLMEAGAFATMKPGAGSVDIGRGSLADKPAVIDAVISGQFTGAAIDVMSRELLSPTTGAVTQNPATRGSRRGGI